MTVWGLISSQGLAVLALGLEMRKKKIVRGLRLKNCGRVILIDALL